MKKLEKMCGVANLRYKKTKQELEELKMVLMMSKEEGDNIRMELKEINDQGRVDERISVLESKLGIDSVMFFLGCIPFVLFRFCIVRECKLT